MAGYSLRTPKYAKEIITDINKSDLSDYKTLRNLADRTLKCMFDNPSANTFAFHSVPQ